MSPHIFDSEKFEVFPNGFTSIFLLISIDNIVNLYKFKFSSNSLYW